MVLRLGRLFPDFEASLRLFSASASTEIGKKRSFIDRRLFSDLSSLLGPRRTIDKVVTVCLEEESYSELKQSPAALEPRRAGSGGKINFGVDWSRLVKIGRD